MLWAAVDVDSIRHFRNCTSNQSSVFEKGATPWCHRCPVWPAKSRVSPSARGGKKQSGCDNASKKGDNNTHERRRCQQKQDPIQTLATVCIRINLTDYWLGHQWIWLRLLTFALGYTNFIIISHGRLIYKSIYKSTNKTMRTIVAHYNIITFT
jgi:hypothetical protein